MLLGKFVPWIEMKTTVLYKILHLESNLMSIKYELVFKLINSVLKLAETIIDRIASFCIV